MSSPAGPVTTAAPVPRMAAAPSGTTVHSGPVAGGHAASGGAADTRVFRSAETILALSVVVVVALLIVPLPTWVLDPLLALSLALSILVLLVTLSTSDPLDFSIFPSLLLLLTLFRLGLNVNSTRLVLGQADAGDVIGAFGNAVTKGNYIVGLVIFVILVVINFMVITKGAGRIAEVAARFTLDAMPGRQMSIDADLNAGLIDETEARKRREEIARYADFFGAMDGAGKFVRGDAVAGLVITAINLVGGFFIGVAQGGMSAGEALATYATLTVGDGLVTQIPALIVSTSAGIIVTYGSTSTRVGPALALQLTRHPSAIWIACGILAVMAILPGFPTVPFAGLAICAGVVAWYATNQHHARATAAAVDVSSGTPPAAELAPMKELLIVDPLELEIGYALVPLVDEENNGDLLQRVTLMRKQVALDLGILVPPVRIRDNIQLEATDYEIRLRGSRVARGSVMPKYLLALNTSGVSEPIEGIKTIDPSFGMPAVWIQPERRLEAETSGYSVVEPQTVLSTHLMETIKSNAADLLGRQECQELLDNLKTHAPALVDDLVPGKLTLGAVHRVLQRLLQEHLSIRNLATIVEAIADAAEATKDVDALVEHIRRVLGPAIAQMYDDGAGTIRGYTIGPVLERAMGNYFGAQSGGGGLDLDPQILASALKSLNDLKDDAGPWKPLIVPPHLRSGVRRLIEPVLPDLPVISLAEIPPQMPIHSLGTWEIHHAA